MGISRLHRSAGLLLGSSLLALASPAGAGDGFSLDWSAPPGCPSKEAVLAEIRRLAGSSGAAESVAARAEVTGRGAGDYHLHIALFAGRSDRSRDIDARTCAELGDAAALIVALAINPGAAEEKGPGEPGAPAASTALPSLAPDRAPPSATPPNTSPPGVSPSSPASEQPSPGVPPKAEENAARVFAEAMFDQGVFRAPAWMGRAGAVLARAPLRFELAGFFTLEQRISAPSTPNKGGDFWLAGGSLTGCYEHAFGLGASFRAAAAGCAGVEVGALGSSGYGIERPASTVSPWVAPVAAALARWAFHPRLALRLDVSVFAPLVRPDFTIEGAGLVHRPGPVGARGGLGLEMLLGSF